MRSPYGYFPGCSLKGAGVAYEESLLTLFGALDLPIAEIRDWNCCGAGPQGGPGERSSFLLAARNLVRADQENRRDLLAPCSACFQLLRKTQDQVARDPVFRKEVKARAGASNPAAIGALRVRHPLEVLHTDVGPQRIRSSTVRAWRGGPVACYYGCRIVSPEAGADNARNPERMDELLRAVGVPTVVYRHKTTCCGGAASGGASQSGLRPALHLLPAAEQAGAEALVTVCPLCQYNLDAKQPEIRSQTKAPVDMPVLYFTQILAWSLGAVVTSLGFRRAVSGRRTIEKWFPKNLD